MSATDAEQRRRAALDLLRARKTMSMARSPSPSHVLVPPSSSPIAPPRIGGGMTIPPSNVNRLAGHANGHAYAPAHTNGSSTLGRAGTPASALAAVQRAPAPESSSAASPDPLARPLASSQFSPSSPQPLSRLKQRYTDDSPARPSPGPAAPGPSRSPTSSSTPRGPSLVAVAKQQMLSEEDKTAQTIRQQYPLLSSTVVADIARRYPTEPVYALREANTYHRQAEAAAAAGKMQSYAYRPLVQPSPLSSPLPQIVSASSAPRVAKPRKNEKSTIYAHRTKGKRRDPDESDSAEGSDWGDSDEDGWSGDDGPRKKKRKANEDEIDAESAALRAFNEAEAEGLTGTIACSLEQAAKIVQLRPYEDMDDVRRKLAKARGVSFKLFEQYMEIIEGYVQIDNCLNRCEAIATDIAATLAVWKGAATESTSVTGTPRPDGLNDVKVDVGKVSEILASETDVKRRRILASYIRTQPALLSEGTVLKDYQLLGVNWLKMLYSRRIGCILADEMGLGKTIQVIAFLAHLKERGVKGPHMIFVPASTLENWTREFERFAPAIDVQTYHGSQAERAELRDDLKRRFRRGDLEVVLASYTQVSSADDLAFFRKKIEFETCIYDEGHMLKNFTSKRYNDLLSIKPSWRLLLTGTPLQNNLQELVSILMFIHKDVFSEAENSLRTLFKVQASGHVNLLSQQRTSRARTMLAPFVLRRRKAIVLTLPPKIETVEKCDMTPVQAKLYRDTLRKSRKMFAELDDATLAEAAEGDADDKPTKPATKSRKKAAAPPGSSSNILMELRKAASHPLLFRRLYTAQKVRQIARACVNSPKWCDSNVDYVIEDLELMSDAEIHRLASDNDELQKFRLKDADFLEGGKVRKVEEILARCKTEDKRMLLFSQFTMILDILEVALDHLGVRFIRLDGQTKTDERQGLVDEFNDDTEITVFLLSTKAGGVGINLTAASVVVIFDQDFNPHNDRQAADRAYRIGQEREVEVIKLISANSIDEDILAIGQTKLQLDDAVGGEGDETGAGATLDVDAGTGAAAKDDRTAKEVKKSLLTTLRHKFEAGGDGMQEADGRIDVEDEPEIEETPGKKRARGVKEGVR
ncbi:DNA-dependent ATPase fun30 [Cryptotrichosporon argae]